MSLVRHLTSRPLEFRGNSMTRGCAHSCHLSFVVCHLSFVCCKSHANGGQPRASATRTTDNGPRTPAPPGPARSEQRTKDKGPTTTARQARREASNGQLTKDHGHRPA